MIGPNCLGSVPWGPNLLGSVQREPNSVRSRLNVLFPQLGSDRTETQVLEVLNANSNRTELDERAVQQFFRPVQSSPVRTALIRLVHGSYRILGIA